MRPLGPDKAGVQHENFALADVFGCHCEATNPALVHYLRSEQEDVRAAVAPAAYVGQCRERIAVLTDNPKNA